MHAITINEKRGHEFEREQEGIHGRTWWEEREGGNDVIYGINQKIFLKSSHQDEKFKQENYSSRKWLERNPK